MNFSTWSIRNPIPAIMFFTLMTFAGIYGFRQLSIQDLPDVSFPVINITLAVPGAAPSQLETDVALKVENALASISGIKHINTTITDGRVGISAQFYLEKNVSDALLQVKDAIDQVRSDLPTETEPPIVAADRSGSSPLIAYAVSSTRQDELDLSWFLDNTIAKRVLTVPGVGKFERVGGVHREIEVKLDPIKLAALEVTALDVSQALKSSQVEASGGVSRANDKDTLVRIISTVSQADDLKKLPISIKNGRSIRLGDVAIIRDTYNKRSQLVLLNQQKTAGFRVYRSNGFDEVSVSKGVEEKVESLKREYPDLTFTPIYDKVHRTMEQYNGSMSMLYEGALLAVLVVFLFLKDWRATAVAATALPLSIIPTYALMYWLGYSLNTLTLLAQAVVVGILVDDAIVEIENIIRHKRMGKPVIKAVSDAVSEIALAVMATTLTIIVVFLPTSMMPGVGGMFFKQFGWTVVISVFMSLLVARLLTPVMALYLLKDTPHIDKPASKAMNLYLSLVDWCLFYKKTTLLLAVIFIGFSVALATNLSAGFLPKSDEGYTTVNVELPPGSSLGESKVVVEGLSDLLQKVDGIAHVFAVIGEGDSDEGADIRKSNLSIVFTNDSERPRQQDIEKTIQKRLTLIPGARFSVESSNSAVSIILASDDPGTLLESAKKLEREMRSFQYLNNIRSTASLERPEIVIVPYLERAAELGISAADIATTLKVATSGEDESSLARLNLDNRQINIRTYISGLDLQDASSISQLRIPTTSGTTALSTLAQVSIGAGPSQIDRYDRQRYITVKADLSGYPLGAALMDIKGLPSMKDLPSSVKLIDDGDAELMNELFSGLGMAMLAGILCVYCVLVLLFKDFFQPITILCALPLSIGGAVIALLVTNLELNLVSLIGIVMLMGIVTKNSILLADYALMNMSEYQMTCQLAIRDACQKRAQPIIMTTIAMIAGMIPIVLGLGGDASFRQPMAIAVIGGLLTSTALSLLIVPVTFIYIHRVANWLSTKLVAITKDNRYP